MKSDMTDPIPSHKDLRRTSRRGRVRRLTALLAALTIALLAVTGCERAEPARPEVLDPNKAYVTTAPSRPADESSIPDKDIVSGTLRLGTRKPASYHPLLADVREYRQLQSLMYQSLFQADGSGTLIPIIAENNGTWDDDQKVVDIRLRPDRHFSNGDAITSTDIANAVRFIQKHENSPYHEAFKEVQNVEAIEQYVIRFTLAERDPFFIYRLQFPVCADAIKESNVPLPGSGRYIFKSLREDGGLELVINEGYTDKAASKVKKISVAIYPSTDAILEGFSNDQLDLVPINHTHFSNLINRQKLSVRAYDSPVYYFLNYNLSADDSPFKRQVDLDRVKGVLSDHHINQQQKLAEVFDPYAFPIPQVLGGRGNNFKNEPRIDSLPPGYEWPEGREIKIIYDYDDEIAELFGQQVAPLLDSCGIPSKVDSMDKEHFDEALKDGSYDIAVCKVQLTTNPDPGWMYGRATPQYLPGTDVLKQVGFEKYTQAIQRLKDFKIVKDELPLDVPQFDDIIFDCERYGPFTGLGFLYEGLMVGSRVRGSLSANSLDPYADLEDVWIWSGS